MNPKDEIEAWLSGDDLPQNVEYPPPADRCDCGAFDAGFAQWAPNGREHHERLRCVLIIDDCPQRREPGAIRESRRLTKETGSTK